MSQERNNDQQNQEQTNTTPQSEQHTGQEKKGNTPAEEGESGPNTAPGMEDGLPKKKGQKKRKFSFYWIYAIVIVLLLYLNRDFLGEGGTKDISLTNFDMLLDTSLVNSITIYKSDADITVNSKVVFYDREKDSAYIDYTIRDFENRFKKKEQRDAELERLEMSKESSDSVALAHIEKLLDERLRPKGPHLTVTAPHMRIERRVDEKNQSLAPANRIPVSYDKRSDILNIILTWGVPIALFILIWVFLMRRVAGGIAGGGSQIFNIGKSRASLYDKDEDVKNTFNDVAGLDEAKEEVMEIVDFLKNSKKYTSLGGKIPKGVLLVGPPGTGKTLLAKAMAGEAKVPFFSISGSDFVEMFVGVGASRVRDLFRQAREKAPCIIFMDEIDAIGRSRGKNMVQSNDERENTLNQLLVEMDGFSGEKGVIILAATNRPDVLDSALLRPGRFDRQISIDKPDMVGREQIFKVHIKPIKIGKDVNIKRLAELTPGFAGAEIANVCNEAALVAARRGHEEVFMIDFQDAVDRVIGGLEKKNKLISPNEKKIIAYHEAGHAVCGWFLEHADPLVKVSIIPRGMAALGYAQFLPKEQYLYTTEQLIDEMCMALGGRAAEEIIFGKISTGALSDLETITKRAYAMVTIYGMNEKVGNVSFYDAEQEYRFNKPYSEETAKLIDDEVRDLISFAYKRTLDLLRERSDELEKVAQTLLKKEIIFQSDLVELIGERPFPSRDFIHEDVVEDTKDEAREAQTLEEESSEESGKNT